MRKAEIKRKTKETNIALKLNIDGIGKTKIDTGIGLLNHMLELFAFWGLFDVGIKAAGDLKIDIHHLNEDIGIVLGEAFKKALGDKKGIRRIGFGAAPMEDVVAIVVCDISGRGSSKLVVPQEYPRNMQGGKDGYTFGDAEHFFDAFAKSFGVNINIEIDSFGQDFHATLEPIFKALGIALDQATTIDPRRKGVPSSKGVID